jgi:6-phosphogluconolactonase (cycloisomerase 2 family)
MALGQMAKRGIAATMLAAVVSALSGCGNFFVYPGSGSTTTNSGDYVFVSNSTTGTAYINGYSISNGTLAATSGSPINVNTIPSSMVITTNNNILYIASCGNTVLTIAVEGCTTGGSNNGIYAYSIGSAGALTSLNSGAAVAGGYPVSLDVSPDGQWLAALDGTTNTITVYSINNSTGALSATTTTTLLPTSGTTITPFEIRFAPTGSFLATSLGDAGTVIIPFTTSNASFGTSYGISALNTPSGADYSIAIDGNNNLYVGRTGGTSTTLGIYAYKLGSTSATLINSSTNAAYTTGARPSSLVLSSGYSYLYSGNMLDTTAGVSSGGSISEFSQSSGALTSLGIAIAAPVEAYSMARDNSGKYILAVGYNSASNGMVLFTIGSSGALTQSAAVTTAAPLNLSTGLPSYPAVMALTH